MNLKEQLYNEVVKAAIAYGQYIGDNLDHPADSITLIIANGISEDRIDSQFVGAGDPKQCSVSISVAMKNYPEFDRIISDAVTTYKAEKGQLFSNS